MKKMSFLKRNFRILSILLLTSALWTSCNSDTYYQGKLIAFATMLNKTCPQNIANGIRMDSVTVPGKKTVEYHYTMTNTNLSDLDTVILKKNVDSALIQEIKTNPEMKELREHDVTLTFTYRDKQSKLVFSSPITPNLYNGKK